MTATVVCVGIAVLDLIFEVDAIPAAASKYPARSCREVAGGIAANAAMAVARLGGRARLVSRLGDDGAGRSLLAALAAAGVDGSALETRRSANGTGGGHTSTSAVMVDPEGERMLVNHKDPVLFEGLPSEAAFAGADAVMCDLRWPAAARAALAAAAEAGVPGVLDYDISPEDGGALLPLASHVIFAEEALRALQGDGDLETALGKMARAHPDAAFAVTAGAGGAFWTAKGERGHVPAVPVCAVDTLGAGDVFHGVAALGLAEGLSFPEALAFAAAAAAFKVSRPSGPGAFPTREDVKTLMEMRG